VVLWTHPTGRKKFSQIDVEQRWFTGAHANVGGGYGDDPLADLPLAWIQEKALGAGLDLTPCTPPADQALTTAPRDSMSWGPGDRWCPSSRNRSATAAPSP
jgi:hypothetical protein